jgi:hypothetical protein
VLTRLGIYTLDNSSDYKSLLPFVINKENLESFLVVIVLDMSRPWTVLQSLDHWLKVIDTHIKSLDAPNVDELRGKGVRAYMCMLSLYHIGMTRTLTESEPCHSSICLAYAMRMINVVDLSVGCGEFRE